MIESSHAEHEVSRDIGTMASTHRKVVHARKIAANVKPEWNVKQSCASFIERDVYYIGYN